MTAEPLCSIGQQQQQKQITTSAAAAAATTTIERNTKSGIEGALSGRRNTKRPVRSVYEFFDTSDSSYYCIDDSEGSNNNNNSNSSSTRAQVSHQLIDSRSILTNKEKLKRFWESKMELEFKSRQQDLNSGNMKNSARNSNGQQQEKLVTLDENNNSNGTASGRGKQSCHSLSAESDVSSIGEVDSSSELQHQQTIQFSDEEWRSLSPNVEPTSAAFKALSAACCKQPLKQSAELLCEKLREYRATCAIGSSNDQQQQQHKQPFNTATNQPSLNNNKDITTITRAHFEQATSNCAAQGLSNDNTILSNASHTDEIQLMSIDPTLCHSGENNGSESAAKSTSQRSDLEHQHPTSARNSLQEDADSLSAHDREEQTVNEEFSSSNSSFGPMSISLPMRLSQEHQGGVVTSNSQDNQEHLELNGSKQAQQCVSDSDDLDSDDDDRNLTQSGSVLTVITLPDDQMKSQTSSASFDHLSTENEVSDLVSSMALESNEHLDSSGKLAEQEQDGDGPKSNIGVAFESLQFDNEIKSSKQEVVEEELCAHPPPVAPPVFKRSLVAKFDSKVVKSVCNFINAAISDATKQVESTTHPSTVAKQISTLEQQESMNEINSISTGNEGDDEAELSNECSSGKLAPSLIRRATFVQENIDEQLLDKKSESEQVEPSQDDATTGCNFKADLSSIFEANVRREIERFETNSAGYRKSSGSKLLNKNALTEWRIAEEIRLFNERELELKKRFKVASKKGGNASCQVLESDGSSSSSITTVDSQQGNFKSCTQSQQQYESLFSARGDNNNQLPIHSKSIRLSTVATSPTNGKLASAQPVTMISMHKFISSGGKRFVFTSSSNNTSSSSSTVTLQNQTHNQQQQLTKSMSNLSVSSRESSKSDRPQVAATKTVDYKAVDSLKWKETPNVKPGLTRKVIETFSRLNQQLNSASDSSISSNQLPKHDIISQQTQSNTHSGVSHRHQNVTSSSSNEYRRQSSPNLAPMTAEWKIQEELREMRAREAELRDQQRNSQHQQHQPIHLSGQAKGEMRPSNGLQNEQINVSNDSVIDNNNKDNVDSYEVEKQEHIRALEKAAAASQISSTQKSSSDRLSFSNESLYPIKQTIDSFKKFSSQANNNNNSMVPSQQNSVTKIQRKLLQAGTSNSSSSDMQRINENDYESKVGGQRRKINMIEKWENGIHAPL